MKCAAKKYAKIAKAILGLSIIGMLIINNIVFIHAHKLPNGYVLIHAHPFNKKQDSAPFKMHHHSHAEFFLLHNLQLLFFVGIFMYGVFLKRLIVRYEQRTIEFFGFSTTHISNRGPPLSIQNFS